MTTARGHDRYPDRIGVGLASALILDLERIPARVVGAEGEVDVGLQWCVGKCAADLEVAGADECGLAEPGTDARSNARVKGSSLPTCISVRTSPTEDERAVAHVRMARLQCLRKGLGVT